MGHHEFTGLAASRKVGVKSFAHKVQVQMCQKVIIFRQKSVPRLIIIRPQHRNKRFLRDVHTPKLFHLGLAFFLFL